MCLKEGESSQLTRRVFMRHKFLFLVGSALHHFMGESFGAHTTEQRFTQTLATVKSIRDRVPDSYVVIYEGSEVPPSEEHSSALKSISDLYLECGQDEVIKLTYENLHNNPRKFVYAKSMLECRCLQIALGKISQFRLFEDTTRIFKLTGRYALNNNFSIADYTSAFLAGKYVMKYYDYGERFTDPENLYSNIYGCRGSMVTGLWSFDTILLNDVFRVLNQSFAYMEKAIGVTAGIDIEHSFYHFINRDLIINPDVLGLDVIKGMDGDTYSI